MNHIPRVLQQHADQAPFMWFRRNWLACSPVCTLFDLARTDERLDAHLEGLRLAGDAGWEKCIEGLECGGAEALFAAAFMAFGSCDEMRIFFVLEKAGDNEEMLCSVISALGWLEYDKAGPQIKRLLEESSTVLRRIGIAASVVHRVDPGKPLLDALSSDNHLFRARALKAAGELGRIDLLNQIKASFTQEDNLCKFRAAWSAAMLGEVGSVATLKTFAHPDWPRQEEALKTAMRCIPSPSDLDWQIELARTADTRRLSVIGAGVIGDPLFIPWLMEQMTVPELARVAGESFTMITGVDIAYADLEGKRPDGFESGPTENPEDEDVEMDPDEDLPWPAPEQITGWWEKNKAGFKTGTRYLLGLPITEENLRQVLRTGRQRQRHAAALELAMMKPGQPLFEVRAPGFRQQRLLGLR